MPRLEILVGMIASGKSTYAAARANAGALVISHDALTQMLHGGAYRYEKELRETYRRMEEALAQQAIIDGRDVVIDRTHLTRESRERWTRYANFGNSMLAGADQIVTVAVIFPIESAFTHAERRFKHDGRGRLLDDWLAVAVHHAEQAQAEPFDEATEDFDAVHMIGDRRFVAAG